MTQKHKLANDIKEELSKFIGQRNDRFTRFQIEADLFRVLWNFSDTLGFSKMPEIETKVNGKAIEITFTDPKTGETISIEEWATRAEGGFYG